MWEKTLSRNAEMLINRLEVTSRAMKRIQNEMVGEMNKSENVECNFP